MFIIRFILTLIHAVVAGLLLGAFANAYIPPKIFPWLNFLSLGFPILWGINLVLTLFWVLMWRKRAFVFLMIAVLCLPALQRWVNFTQKPKETADIRVISLNTHAGREGEATIEPFFREQNPDIIFVQEGAFLNDRPPMKGYFKTNDSQYLHIFSKFPILNSGVIYSEDQHIAQAIYADVQYKGKTFRLINFYLEPFQLDHSEKQVQNVDRGYLNKFKMVFKEHQPQVNTINKAIKASPHPVIVAGDMNAVPNSYEYYKISEGLLDSFKESGVGIGTTFSDAIFPIKIDYVFSSKQLKPIISKVFKEEKLSDHSPIITEFKVK